MAELRDLSGRTALVTGSATGLGRSIALKLAERGAEVIINCSRSVADAEATVSDCQALGAQARLVQADVATEEGCRTLAEAAGASGRLDILVNNAGITRHARDHSDLNALSKDDFLDTYAVNVVGPFLMVQACRHQGRAQHDDPVARPRARSGDSRQCRLPGIHRHALVQGHDGRGTVQADGSRRRRIRAAECRQWP